MTLSLHPMIQSLILHMFAKVEKIALTVPEKTVTQIYLGKTEKWIKKGKKKSDEPDSPSTIL